VGFPPQPATAHFSEAAGIIEVLDQDLVQLRIAENWTRWVPLLQNEAINGVEVETARRLERPEVAGVVERTCG
jgi:hypothetical protein